MYRQGPYALSQSRGRRGRHREGTRWRVQSWGDLHGKLHDEVRLSNFLLFLRSFASQIRVPPPFIAVISSSLPCPPTGFTLFKLKLNAWCRSWFAIESPESIFGWCVCILSPPSRPFSMCIALPVHGDHLCIATFYLAAQSHSYCGACVSVLFC